MNRDPTIYHIQIRQGEKNRYFVNLSQIRWELIRNFSSIFTRQLQHFSISFFFWVLCYLVFFLISLFCISSEYRFSYRRWFWTVREIKNPLRYIANMVFLLLGPLLHINAAQTNIVMLVVCSEFVPQICYWPNFFFVNLSSCIHTTYNNYIRTGFVYTKIAYMLMYYVLLSS